MCESTTVRVYERLKEYIRRQGYKQKAVGERAGYTETQMSALLNGNKILTADDLEKICRALGTSPGDIYNIRVPEQRA